jgi:hypothetical protein
MTCTIAGEVARCCVVRLHAVCDVHLHAAWTGGTHECIAWGVCVLDHDAWCPRADCYDLPLPRRTHDQRGAAFKGGGWHCLPRSPLNAAARWGAQHGARGLPEMPLTEHSATCRYKKGVRMHRLWHSLL